ncbi:MAG: hypothetical protein IKH90_09100 [Ruminococcus sp.]|nr:hypothetical protein [Ruminococcus sp.]
MRLTDFDEPFVTAGTVFTFTGEHPFDKGPVDFMLCEYHSGKADRCGFAFYCVSGYHSGSLEYVLPIEAKAEGAVAAVSTQWLKEHWKSHVYGGCEACDVMLSNWIWDQQEINKSNTKE